MFKGGARTNNIEEFMTDYEQYGGLALNWWVLVVPCCSAVLFSWFSWCWWSSECRACESPATLQL